jgi:hypothetical protein
MNRFFPVNEHPVERVLRVAAGLALVGFSIAGTIGPWGYLGAVPLLTGLIGSCPLYTVFGFSTCPVKGRTSAD